MTGIKMADRPETSSKRRNALRNAMLMTGGLGVAIGAATTLANQSAAGEPPVFSPIAGLLIVTVGLVGFVVLTTLYIKRTDEHDLLANLWALSIGLIFIIAAAPAWWMLEHAGLVVPVNLWVLYILSGLVSTVVWLWLRFR